MLCVAVLHNSWCFGGWYYLLLQMVNMVLWYWFILYFQMVLYDIPGLGSHWYFVYSRLLARLILWNVYIPLSAYRIEPMTSWVFVYSCSGIYLQKVFCFRYAFVWMFWPEQPVIGNATRIDTEYSPPSRGRLHLTSLRR